MQSSIMARRSKDGGDGFRPVFRRVLRRAGLGAALVLAVLVGLPFAGVAQDGWDAIRPEPRGGSGPVVELPPTWQPEPLHRYHREVFFTLEVGMGGLEGMALFPMAAQIRQEVVMETTARDEKGRLFVRVTMSEPEVVKGAPDLAAEFAAANPVTFWIRLTEHGRWDVLYASGEGGGDLDHADLEAMLVTVRGPLWPEAPRVGSSWDVEPSQLAGLEEPLGEIPDVLMTATLEAVERVDGEQVARIVFHLPETRFEAPVDDEMTFMMAGAFAQVAADGLAQVRVRDGLTLATRIDARSVAGLGPGTPGMSMGIQVEERALGDEPLAVPPVVPDEVLQAP